MAAVAAAQPQESVREDAALQERVEFVLHELRQSNCFGGLRTNKAQPLLCCLEKGPRQRARRRVVMPPTAASPASNSNHSDGSGTPATKLPAVRYRPGDA